MAGGRPPKERSFANMLRIAIMEATPQGPIKLRMVAEALVEKAITGDVPAIKELADRLDGKVPQAVVGDDEHSPIRAELIRRVIVDPRSTAGADDPDGEAADPAA